MANKAVRYFDRETGFQIHAMRLVGSAGRTISVCQWVVENNYPWLIGNALKPEQLKPHNGEAGDQGIWLDPANGNLVIRHDDGVEYRGEYGDWVYILADGTALTSDHDAFMSQFTTRQPVGASRKDDNG